MESNYVRRFKLEDLIVKIENLIMDNIIIDISEGRYKHNDKLPYDNELADKYGVSRIKIRKVYERLEAMRIIYEKHYKLNEQL